MHRIAVAGLILGLAGCYGSTEKATNVTTESAVLNAQGTTNAGPAESWFEYWATATPQDRATTPKQEWPGGISGPFSRGVDGLLQGTRYTFRMCGNDVGEPPVCAQERTFETQSPDSVVGTASNATVTATLNASSGPAGEDPSGTFDLLGTSQGVPAGFRGPVDCLEVDGETARLASTGRPFIGGTVGPFVTYYAKVTPGSIDYQTGELSPTPDCGSYDGGGEVLQGTFTIMDSPPPEPPT
jgi:hypothetical protein